MADDTTADSPYGISTALSRLFPALLRSNFGFSPMPPDMRKFNAVVPPSGTNPGGQPPQDASGAYAPNVPPNTASFNFPDIATNPPRPDPRTRIPWGDIQTPENRIQIPVKDQARLPVGRFDTIPPLPEKRVPTQASEFSHGRTADAEGGAVPQVAGYLKRQGKAPAIPLGQPIPPDEEIARRLQAKGINDPQRIMRVQAYFGQMRQSREEAQQKAEDRALRLEEHKLKLQEYEDKRAATAQDRELKAQGGMTYKEASTALGHADSEVLRISKQMMEAQNNGLKVDPAMADMLAFAKQQQAYYRDATIAASPKPLQEKFRRGQYIETLRGNSDAELRAKADAALKELGGKPLTDAELGIKSSGKHVAKPGEFIWRGDEAEAPAAAPSSPSHYQHFSPADYEAMGLGRYGIAKGVDTALTAADIAKSGVQEAGQGAQELAASPWQTLVTGPLHRMTHPWEAATAPQEQLRAGLDGPFSKMASGAVGAASAPVTAALETGVAQPVESVTGSPVAGTAASFLAPMLAGKMAGLGRVREAPDLPPVPEQPRLGTQTRLDRQRQVQQRLQAREEAQAKAKAERLAMTPEQRKAAKIAERKAADKKLKADIRAGRKPQPEDIVDDGSEAVMSRLASERGKVTPQPGKAEADIVAAKTNKEPASAAKQQNMVNNLYVPAVKANSFQQNANNALAQATQLLSPDQIKQLTRMQKMYAEQPWQAFAKAGGKIGEPMPVDKAFSEYEKMMPKVNAGREAAGKQPFEVWDKPRFIDHYRSAANKRNGWEYDAENDTVTFNPKPPPSPKPLSSGVPSVKEKRAATEATRYASTLRADPIFKVLQQSEIPDRVTYFKKLFPEAMNAIVKRRLNTSDDWYAEALRRMSRNGLIERRNDTYVLTDKGRAWAKARPKAPQEKQPVPKTKARALEDYALKAPRARAKLFEPSEDEK